MEKIFLIISFILFSVTAVWAQTGQKQSRLLDREPPGLVPKKFAPGIISTDNKYEFGSFLAKNAKTFYYAVRLNKQWKAEIRYSKFRNGHWTKPRRVELDDKYSYNDPVFSKDRNRLYFMTNRAADGGAPTEDSDLWYVKRTKIGWSRPINLGIPVNSEKNEFYLSFAGDGTLYFASNRHTSKKNAGDHDIYFSSFRNGSYQQPVQLGEAINSKYFEVDPYIAPDGSYLIYSSSRPGGLGEGDLYISFKQENGSWSKAKNMGKPINAKNHEFCPFVTRNGKYFFYTSNGDIYWVSGKIIKKYER